MTRPGAASSTRLIASRRGARRLSRLRALRGLVHEADSLRATVEQGLAATVEITGARRGMVALADEDQHTMCGLLGLDVPADLVRRVVERLDEQSGNASILATVARTLEPALIYSDDPKLDSTILACLAPFEWALVLPLVSRSRLLGTMALAWDRPLPNGLRPLATPLLLAEQIAGAIDVQLRLEQERHERLVAEELHAMTQRITAGLGLDDALAAVLRAVERLLDATSASIFLERQGAQVADRRFTTRNTGEPHWDDHAQVRPDGLTLTVLRTGQPIVVEDAASDPRVAGNSRDRSRTFVVTPIRHDDRTVGVLFANWTERHQLSPADLRLLETLAAYGAIAIQNARVHAQQVEAARFDGVLLAARTISHEINNDLTLTMGMAELAQMQVQSGDIPDTLILEDVIRGAQRIAKHVRQLQNVVRLEERRLRDIPPVLDLAHSIEREPDERET